MSQFLPARFGVCTLRVEVQPEHLLITVTTHRYAAPGARHAFISPTLHFVRPEQAIDAAEQFLESFGHWDDTPKPGSALPESRG